MPFVEIEKDYNDWIKIGENKISIPKKIRDKYFTEENGGTRARLFYDEENSLFGIKPSQDGYKIDRFGRITCRRLPPLEKNKYFYFWDEDEKMLVVDLLATKS